MLHATPRSRVLCLICHPSLSFLLCKSLELLNRKAWLALPCLRTFSALPRLQGEVQVVSVACESFTAGSILPSQPHTSQSLEHAMFFFFLPLFLMTWERECPFQPFSDWSVSYSPSTSLQVSWDLPGLVLSCVPLALCWGCYAYRLFLCSDSVLMVLNQ